MLDASWLLLIATWGLIASTWVISPMSKNLYIALVVLTTLLACIAIMGHRQTRMEGGYATLSLQEMLSSTDKLPKIAFFASVALGIVLVVVDWRFGPERPDDITLTELVRHPHAVRAMLGVLTFFQALAVATASSAIKVRDAWMNL